MQQAAGRRKPLRRHRGRDTGAAAAARLGPVSETKPAPIAPAPAPILAPVDPDQAGAELPGVAPATAAPSLDGEIGAALPHLVQLRCCRTDAGSTQRDRHVALPLRPAGPGRGHPTRMRNTKVVLTTTHLDHESSHSRLCNLSERCHMLHDRPRHLAQPVL